MLNKEQVKENLMNKGVSEERADKLVNSREYLIKVWDAASENLEMLAGILPENDKLLVLKKKAVKDLYNTQKYHLVYNTKINNDEDAIDALSTLDSFIREWTNIFKLPR